MEADIGYRYCRDCEGAPAYPGTYTGEDGREYRFWLCSSSGCYVGEEELVSQPGEEG